MEWEMMEIMVEAVNNKLKLFCLDIANKLSS